MPFSSQMVSYAQNREDVLLARAFRDQPHGFYVDVGAHDPTICSVTRHFYDRGWHGINVEPGSIFARLAAARPRDVNLEVAVSDRDDEVTFYEHPADPGTSTLSATPSERLIHGTGPRRERRVRSRTLASILAEHAPPVIDFLSLDVEGHERQALSSNDWSRFRPRVLVVEATLPYSNEPCHQGWEPILLAAGYLFAYFDGINRFYVRGEDEALLRHFAWPVNVLDNYVPADAARISGEKSSSRSELNRMHEVLARVREHAKNVESKARLLDEALRRAQEERTRLLAGTGRRTLGVGLFLARGLHRIARAARLPGRVVSLLRKTTPSAKGGRT